MLVLAFSLLALLIVVCTLPPAFSPADAELGVAFGLAPADGGPSSLLTSIAEFLPASDWSLFFTVVLAYLADLLD